MFRLFLFGCLVLNCLWAKNLYHVAVCGVSRSSEELELALELSDSILVKKCQDKKLDASVKILPSKIEAYGPQGVVILSQKRTGPVLTERKAQQFITALMGRLSKPEKIMVAKPPSVRGDITDEAIQEPANESRNDDISREFELAVSTHPETPIVWKLESLASVDQWNYQISTKVYPGVQIGTQVELPDNWILQGRSAFGTSAFQVSENIAWNQQVFLSVNAGNKFELSHGFSVMPKAGYLFWGSFSGSDELPSFARHDLELGAELIYLLSEPKIELRILLSALPVNLGLQSSLAARYYFLSSWFASVQAGTVALWAHDSSATFLSASLGLGIVL